jgi:hypothetical protein
VIKRQHKIKSKPPFPFFSDLKAKKGAYSLQRGDSEDEMQSCGFQPDTVSLSCRKSLNFMALENIKGAMDL